MSRLQGASIAALLAIVCSHSHADTIVVNTSDDENNVLGSKCSIREAVSYINQKNIVKKNIAPIESSISQKNSRLGVLNNEKKVLEIRLADASAAEKPALESEIAQVKIQIQGIESDIAILQTAKKNLENQIIGFQIYGCVPKSVTDTDEVVLPAQKTPFNIDLGEIQIKDSIIIKLDDTTQSSSQLTDSTADDLVPAIIQAGGTTPSRIFMLDDGQADATKRIAVRFLNLDLRGCRANAADLTACAVDGGIVYNKEDLTLTNVKFSLGGASGHGGALFNADQAFLLATGVNFEANRAPDGAAFYSTQSGVSIQQSLFYKNTGVNPADTIVHILTGVVPSSSLLTRRSIISDTTLSTNIGTALSVPEQIRLLSLTVVANTAGVDFRGLDINLTSSIIAQDGAAPQDCLNVGASTKFRYNLYMSAACPGTVPADMNRQISGTGDEKLFAGPSSDAATCDLPPATGLLCPLGNFGGSTRSHKPRLLASYSALTDSPIVNKGVMGTGNADNDCNNVDQRGKARTLCDIGAVELLTTNSDKQGQDVLVGQTVHFSMLEKIGDGELMPAARCAAVVKDPRADLTKDGCPFLTILPGKGSVTFDDVKHEAVYVPGYAYHGFDRFSYAYTTTLSRFSDANNDKTVVMSVKVVADPASGIDDKNYAGSLGIWGLLSLLGLTQLRRRVQRG
ncbi:rhombotarget A family protein [Fluviicoccus keumensis]|uniref:Rhombotarget A family protein n=1 Tax=Fluviicoccus keumensis TaxID=1435465 RepID=A0A4Q7Z4N9_9GAMM|nr:CSLREA domain-containing protein [Fluviicoccus keumensis]RZU45320.1 rhombotarget A family protein [Fluviicoccus keumensis]